ncbi:MAG: PIN domain-containing protein [Clostridiales bacterium]|nr:PIN domain-containing protein [Clostridiales bacterium]
MSRKILVDTSIWVSYFKNDPSTTVFIEKNLFTKEIYITGPIITELLDGAKGTKEKERLQYSIGAVNNLNVTVEDWILAGKLMSDMRTQGKILNKTDAVIASVAINNNCELLSMDEGLQNVNLIKKAQIS